MSNYENKLIYGVDSTTRVVSVEPQGEKLIVFRELENGEVVQENHEARYWFITNKSISPAKEYKLEGNQFFKYFHEFPTLEKQREVRAKLYQKRLEFYDIYDAKESNLVIHGMTYYKGMKSSEVSILSTDIETDGLIPTSNSEIYIITNTFRRLGTLTRKTFKLCDYSNQKEMLEAWCDWVREMDPSIICGHNIYVYDFFYIRHVAKLCGAKLNLGRDGSEIRFNEKPSKKRKDGSQEYEYYKFNIFGREICDTFFLALTFDVQRNFESYVLKPIIKYFELEKSGRTFVDASKIRKYYNERLTNPEPWEKTLQYAEEDSDDALQLFDKMVPAFFYTTQHISKTFTEMINSATGSQINNFLVRAYLQDGHSIPKATEILEKVKGGISFAVPGVYRHLSKIDLKSAYPSQILRFKLFDKEKDPKGYFYQMIVHFAERRFELKKLVRETKDAEQKAEFKKQDDSAKVFLNSAYGVTITNGLNFNSPAIGAQITAATREVLDNAMIYVSGKDKTYWIDLFEKKTGKKVEEYADEV